MAITGYYDGTSIQTKTEFKTNQKVIIIPVDDDFQMNSAEGSLADFADPSLIPMEKDAWRRAAVKKHE
jgi:hypothetical protein